MLFQLGVEADRRSRISGLMRGRSLWRCTLLLLLQVGGLLRRGHFPGLGRVVGRERGVGVGEVGEKTTGGLWVGREARTACGRGRGRQGVRRRGGRNPGRTALQAQVKVLQRSV